ncbi:hypothetical protein E2C01_100550 [Portunus trituberculatus]|uniref:Uncharacterized protein n=1 Tax=Portunus trituberculatus TaxID=210409 RepID=A0A5B7KI88_PORTR|nr:hypothetical protein [Portunus trituberculatus]
MYMATIWRTMAIIRPSLSICRVQAGLKPCTIQLGNYKSKDQYFFLYTYIDS